ncbi:MAG: hypothetical protein BIP78_0136 [Candidatus Bipolaricaulis sibiricus]|uniref:ATP-grasp domain-containing protein n=1 Tax=Bipolaricaulis sibiricus TaxID=2501609 RepID=A0A410FSE2_BIPS1|nr:MAG: hypothetical protein BIP78_0136 [Candidatus Bipolaricaulis sibiricus]
MHVGLIMDRPPSAIMLEVIGRLAHWGIRMEVLDADRALVNLGELSLAHDWYVLKGGSQAALTIGGMLHMAGAKLLHSYPTTVILRNKLVVMQALQEGGLLVPETFLVTRAADIAPLLASGPLIVKPNDGRREEGVQVVRTPEDLLKLNIPAPILVQRYCPPDEVCPVSGRDLYLKVYRIGDRIFGTRRVWPRLPAGGAAPEPCPVSANIEQIARAVGEIFGLTLYGLDVVVSCGQPHVVDVIPMGSCDGVPNAAQHLADYFREAGERFA